MLNNFDRDNFLVRCMEGVELCLLPVAESAQSFRTLVVVAEFNSVQLSFSVSPSNDGDALRHLLDFPESESDVLPSDSS